VSASPVINARSCGLQSKLVALNQVAEFLQKILKFCRTRETLEAARRSVTMCEAAIAQTTLALQEA
jgi:hypothetical protein